MLIFEGGGGHTSVELLLLKERGERGEIRERETGFQRPVDHTGSSQGRQTDRQTDRERQRQRESERETEKERKFLQILVFTQLIREIGISLNWGGRGGEGGGGGKRTGGGSVDCKNYFQPDNRPIFITSEFCTAYRGN